jgi:hypothetical protein
LILLIAVCTLRPLPISTTLAATAPAHILLLLAAAATKPAAEGGVVC